MIILKLDGQLAPAGLDVGTAARPALIQSGVDADDLPDWPLRRIGSRPFRKPHPQSLAKVLFQGGVVSFGGGNIGLEEHPAVNGQPPSVQGCTLFAIATWVCRSGSPARLSRWVNAT